MKIGLLGHGVVGSGVRKIIDDAATPYTKDLQVAKILVKDEWEMTDERMTMNADDILDDPDIDIVAECMGGIEPARTFLMKALKNGKHIVTSNKKMLAVSASGLFEEAEKQSRMICYEAACGGGIPWMANLYRTRRIDAITSFRGIFNGTTNYILSRMTDEKKSFEEMLKEAQDLGYAERDPSDDIDGYDVRYKVMLSCMRAFGVIISAEDIPVFGIRTIREEDLAWADENGYVCKLIGTAQDNNDCISACVMPVFLRKTDGFANIRLNFNAIESCSDTLGSAVYTGQGAGSLPTAHAVVQDLIDIQRENDSAVGSLMRTHAVNTDHKGIYYIRTEKMTVFNDILDRRVSENAFLTRTVSLNEVSALIRTADDSSLFAAEVDE